MAEEECVEFCSRAWIARAHEILVELAAEHGQPKESYSVCEVFTDAPESISASGSVAWHFFIEGKSVRVGRGEVDDVDLKICADYAETLPIARLIYTPETLAQRTSNKDATSGGVVRGDRRTAPSYLVELHNRLALVTA